MDGLDLIATEQTRTLRAEMLARERRIAHLLAIAQAGRRGAADGQRRSLGRALRVRAGQLLVALGSTLEGGRAAAARQDDPCAETATRAA
jgi:erythromycin esterase-like protein